MSIYPIIRALRHMLAKLQPAFDDDDVINARNEDSLRSYEQAVDKVRTETKARVSHNARLRSTLADAKKKTRSIAT